MPSSSVICAPNLTTTPENTTLTKNNTAEPGLSRLSIVSLPYGVLYASQNGLILLSSQGVTTPTEQIITKDEWEKRTTEPYPENIADLIIAKHRNGPTARTHLFFRKTLTKFENLSAKGEPPLL